MAARLVLKIAGLGVFPFAIGIAGTSPGRIVILALEGFAIPLVTTSNGWLTGGHF